MPARSTNGLPALAGSWSYAVRSHRGSATSQPWSSRSIASTNITCSDISMSRSTVAAPGTRRWRGPPACGSIGGVSRRCSPVSRKRPDPTPAIPLLTHVAVVEPPPSRYGVHSSASSAERARRWRVSSGRPCARFADQTSHRPCPVLTADQAARRQQDNDRRSSVRTLRIGRTPFIMQKFTEDAPGGVLQRYDISGGVVRLYFLNGDGAVQLLESDLDVFSTNAI